MNEDNKMKAMEYIYKKKEGNYEELVEKFGKDTIDLLCKAGLIKIKKENINKNIDKE